MDIYNIETKINFMEDEGITLRELAEKILKASEEFFESVDWSDGTWEYPPGVSVVPVRNNNNHNYYFGIAYVSRRGDAEPYGGRSHNLFFEASNGITSPDDEGSPASWNGDRGNNMSTHREDVRCPTINEIEIYLYDLFANKSEYYILITKMYQ